MMLNHSFIQCSERNFVKTHLAVARMFVAKQALKELW